MPKYTRTYLIGCDMNFSDASGILSSPLHPNPYPSGKDCAYIISQPNGTYINFTVVTMDIDCQDIGFLRGDMEMPVLVVSSYNQATKGRRPRLGSRDK